jgi:RND family efflux transporter MFP subunit
MRAAAIAALGLLLLAGRAGAESVPVEVAEVVQAPILREVRLTGTVTAERNARLSVATSGLVKKITVEEGTHVAPGDVLLELDPELAELQWQAASASTEQARLALRDARRRLQEARALAPQQSIAETAVRDLEAEVAEDEALLSEAQARAGYQKALLERHTLRAPFAGVISGKLTELGQWVEPGQAVLDLVAMDALRLDFAVAEDYLPRITQDAAVSFRLNAAPERLYRGRVATIVPVTDPGARTFLLRVYADEPVERLLPGMSVEATLRLETGSEGITVPRDATLRYPDGRVIVWTIVPGEDGPRVRENLVTTGLAFDGLVEIREGLAAGDRVVVRGNEALQGGQRVQLRGER